MPILIALAVAVAFFVWRAWGRDKAEIEVGSRLNRLFKKKKCKWHETGGGSGNLIEYKCQSCKVTAYSGTGRAPQECKRNLGGSL